MQGSLDEGVGDIVPHPPPPSTESFETAMQSAGQQRQRPKLSKLSSFECASLSSGKSLTIMKVIEPKWRKEQITKYEARRDLNYQKC